jgi:hypothetical protein
MRITPLCIENARGNVAFSLISRPLVGALNEKKCKRFIGVNTQVFKFLVFYKIFIFNIMPHVTVASQGSRTSSGVKANKRASRINSSLVVYGAQIVVYPNPATPKYCYGGPSGLFCV